MQFRLAAIVLVFAAACGGKAKPSPTTPPPSADTTAVAPTGPTASPATPAAEDPEFEAAMRGGATFVADLADSVAAVGADCTKIAAAIDATLARHRAVFDKIAAYDKDPTMKPRTEAWLQSHQGELAAPAQKLGEAIAPCIEDPAVQAAVQKLSM